MTEIDFDMIVTNLTIANKIIWIYNVSYYLPISLYIIVSNFIYHYWFPWGSLWISVQL